MYSYDTVCRLGYGSKAVLGRMETSFSPVHHNVFNGKLKQLAQITPIILLFVW
jgi:hypothetical protein